MRRGRWRSSAKSPRSATAWRAPGRKYRRSRSPPSRATPSAAGSRSRPRSTGASSPSDAFVSLPEIALGIPLTWGTLPRLVNLVGPARAKRLAILCERIPAAEALAMGLVDYIAPPGKALATARAVAKQVLSLPRNSVRMTKESVNAYAGIGAHAASHMAHDQVQLAAASAEAKAAREAFARRRKASTRAGAK